VTRGQVAVDVDPAREEEDLRRYLGDEFDLAKLQRYQETLDDEFARCGDEEAFYRTSRAYLYNLTAFAMTQTKLPYLRVLTGLIEPGARVLDYGCGIGSDGIALAEAGYRVEFADFENPSTEYLRWRLRERGLSAEVHNLDEGVPSGYDAAFAFDVIEHVTDAVSFLGEMEARADLVEVNFLEEDNDQPLHHELPVRALVGHAAEHDLRFYRVLHGSSHLVAYRPVQGGPGRRLLNRTRVVAARARAGASALSGRRGRARPTS
jgi:SAM-dependent methyltransferase